MDSGVSRAAPRRPRMSEENRHILLGAGVFLAFVLLLAFSASGDYAPAGSYRISAKFNTVEGIYVGSAVRLSGVKVGRVAALDYESQTFRAVVTMEISRGLEIPLDSLALVTSEGMLGGRFIRLDPGGEIEMLQDGDEIEFTQDSILFEELLAKIILTIEQQRLDRRAAEREAGSEPQKADQ